MTAVLWFSRVCNGPVTKLRHHPAHGLTRRQLHPKSRYAYALRLHCAATGLCTLLRASTMTPGLSVFFPAYNDAATIASLVIAAVQTASRLTPDFEVIVINDGSTDATAAMADE